MATLQTYFACKVCIVVAHILALYIFCYLLRADISNVGVRSGYQVGAVVLSVLFNSAVALDALMIKTNLPNYSSAMVV